MAKVLGVGGVFFKAKDSTALGEWYQKHLGVPVEPPYGANFMPAMMPAGGLTVWAPFKHDTEYFAPSEREFMFNLVVDNLEEALQQVRAAGAEVMDETMDEEYGKFGWFVDPEGTKVELWEPKAFEES
jgi:predicted enzyme related to lactoylglutathione lyase